MRNKGRGIRDELGGMKNELGMQDTGFRTQKIDHGHYTMK
jgi:hypothetical protein